MSDVAAKAWPLRPRGLAAQLLVLVLGEYAMFQSYRDQDAAVQWSTDLLVGLTAAVLLNLAWLVVRAAPARGAVISVLAAHMLAMVPDLLFGAGAPGGRASWLAVALVAAGGYGACVVLWIRARTREARDGLVPGVGIGGIGLIAAQRNPEREPLAHARYGPEGKAGIVLLHGFGASHLIWGPAGAELGHRGERVLVPDLLGFGASRRIGTRFELADHVAALSHLFDATRTRFAVVAGHSFGCAVAVAFAAACPSRVSRLVLAAPPAIRDAAMARARLAQEGWLTRKVVEDSPAASLSCALMCLLRPAVGAIAPRIVPAVPAEVARDGVQHSWPAYRAAVATLLEASPVPRALEHPTHPTMVVLGDVDRRTPKRDVLDHPHEAVQVVELPGDHLFVYEDGHAIADVIAGGSPRRSPSPA